MHFNIAVYVAQCLECEVLYNKYVCINETKFKPRYEFSLKNDAANLLRTNSTCDKNKDYVSMLLIF